MDERGQPLRPSLEEEGEDHGLEISRLLYDLEKVAIERDRHAEGRD